MTRLPLVVTLLAALCLLVLSCCLLLSMPLAVHAQPQLPFAAIVSTNANLRSGPGTNYDRIGSAQAGQTVQVVECNDGCTWYKLDGGAWIFAELVQPQSATQEVSAATPAATSSGGAAAADTANLRSGPGTSYARIGGVSAGQSLNITGRNVAGDWYQLADGAWIAAFLVSGAPADLPVAAEPAVAAPAAAPAEAPQPEQPAGSPNLTIRYINYDGGVYRVESDEYAEVANTGNAPANLGGWVIYAGDPGQTFTFPSYELGPGQSCRIYTNEYHPESCGFSFGRGQAIWNNKGDCGALYDPAGNEVDAYCY